MESHDWELINFYSIGQNNKNRVHLFGKVLEQLSPNYSAHIVDRFKQWPTEIYRLILQRKTTFFAIIIAICNVECPTLSNTVHSKSRRRKLFVVGYRFQQTEEWCGRETRKCLMYAPSLTWTSAIPTYYVSLTHCQQARNLSQFLSQWIEIFG